MDLLVEVNPQYVQPQQFKLPILLDAVEFVRANWDKSIADMAITLEDYEPAAIKLPTPRRVSMFRRLMDLVNYLNLDSVLMRPSTNVEEFLKIAAEYGVVVSWIIGPSEPVPMVKPPHRLRLAMDIPSFRSLKSMLRFLVPNMGIVRFLEAHNVKGGVGGYPIMDGPIDYLKIVKILMALKWDGSLVLKYSKEYVNRYNDDYTALKSFMDAAGSEVLDDDMVRLIRSVLREFMDIRDNGRAT